MLYIPNNLSW